MSWYSTSFLHLYSNVFEKDSVTYCAAFHTSLVYEAIKLAAFHTSVVYEATRLAIAKNPQMLRSVLHSLEGPLQICSLGSGPGTDIIGVLAAVHDKFGFFPSYAELVDLMSEWKETFQSVVDELRSQSYGTLSESVSGEWFDWSFQTADLKREINEKLKAVIRKADLITMIKFVSATDSQETSEVIERIFDVIKPGALVLFVDNAVGGFQEMVSDAAEKYHLKPAFRSLTHELNKAFCNDKFGYESCYKTRVAVQLLSKLDVAPNPREVRFPKKLPLLQILRFSPTSTSDPQNRHQAKNISVPQGQIANSRFDRDSICDGLSSNQALPSRFHGSVRSSTGPRSRRDKPYHRPHDPLLPLPRPHPNGLLHPGWPSRPLGVSQTYQANGDSVNYGGEDPLDYGNCENSVNYGSCDDSGNYKSFEDSGYYKGFEDSGHYKSFEDSGIYGSFGNSVDYGSNEDSGICGSFENSVKCQDSGIYGGLENLINYGNRENSGIYGSRENAANYGSCKGSGNYGSSENSGIYDCENARIFEAYESAQVYDDPQIYESYDNSQRYGPYEETQTNGSYERLRAKKAFKRPLLKEPLLKTPHFSL